MTWELRIETPDRRVTRLPLDAERLTVGRAHSNDLSYPDDASLSRKHLVLERTDGAWTVSDLRSKNGTTLNGVRVEGRQPLAPGDRLCAGQLTITVADPDLASTSSVVFVGAPEPGLATSATLMSSLEGVFSAERLASPVPAAAPGIRRGTFDDKVLHTLLRAGKELSGHRPLDELFRLILDMSIETVGAQRGVLMTLEGPELLPRAVHGEGFRISTFVRDRVLQDKTSVLVSDAASDEAVQNQQSIIGEQIHSLMAVPLQTEDRVIGLVYVDSRQFVREFSADDLNLLTVLANVAAIRIEQERHLVVRQRDDLRTQDLKNAAEIQRGILPALPPAIPGYELAGSNAPSRTVGGDYYDWVRYADGRLLVVLADVAGKGMAAALLMSNLQARVQLLGEEATAPGPLLARLGRSLGPTCPPNRFITMFAALLDPGTGRVSWSSAGHNPALLVRADGTVEALTACGTPLGALAQLDYPQRTVEIAAGDLLFAYSDGVTEAVSAEDDEFGPERLVDIVRGERAAGAAAVIAAVNVALAQWTGNAPPTDDVTAVAVWRLPTAGPA
jgi:serine phosphatase RsbU (regulator of sigma subunit)